MISSLVGGILISGLTWIVWKAFKLFVLQSQLDNLPGPPSKSFIFGNINELLSYNGWDFNRHVLNTYGRAMRITGTFGSRLFLTYDPKALHHILVKDQQFYEPSGFVSRNKVYLGEGLLSVMGEQHRKQRKMMNPVFSIKHMREMIPVFYEVTERLRTAMKLKLQDGPQEVNVLDWISRTALELIGQSGMDYSFDSLVDEENSHPYADSLKQLAAATGGPFGFILNEFLFPFAEKWNFPRLKRFVIELIPSQRVQKIKRLVDLMYNVSQEIIQKKKRALESCDKAVVAEMMEKKDIISILMRANSQADQADRLTDDEVCGQVSTFVFAAMDTTSSALARVLQLLSIHPDAQEKLRAEICDAQKDGQLTYDQLVSLPYLDAVCRETLRLFPPINMPFVRIAARDTIVPLAKPIIGQNDKEMREVIVPKGTNILLSILGSNTDPDLWGADASEWKPERWLSPFPDALGEAHLPGIYSNLMTFLGGGRACIGFKFSQLEMKIVLAVLLSSFKFEVAEKHNITWKMTGIAGPYVESLDAAKPQLPLIMTSLVN
ncbi:hypothetical protein Agabi119p4_10037 [Agaricus bisporus var. burnettii]|uniref:Cytochrome P450 n=1 Tax=Agaricus bisporus var. burnettii TaxID=192524 RepID=A0A8H7EVX7_AGABI|nr:hypothetical protein Agabi119p4_10037 [Agaricus bisporus var. burnettii]